VSAKSAPPHARRTLPAPGEPHRGIGFHQGAFGSGGASQSWANRLSDFELAGSSFHHFVAVYAEDERGALSSRTEAGNIGNGILQNFALEFDYSHERTWFDRVPGFTPPPFSLSGLILFKNDPKTLVVANTMKNSPGADAGLRQGDAIVTIGNQNIERRR
jgi:hypothetical protein